MIAPAAVAMMARYNAWQDGWVIPACDALTQGERQQDRGLFFGSIHGTLSHILWGDDLWLARFTGGTIPETHQRDSGTYVTDWETLKARRADTDKALCDWAATVSQDFLDSTYRWTSRKGAQSRAMAQIVLHLFNHQTHHRGQIHAALTQAGRTTRDTDLFYLEDD